MRIIEKKISLFFSLKNFLKENINLSYKLAFTNLVPSVKSFVCSITCNAVFSSLRIKSYVFSFSLILLMRTCLFFNRLICLSFIMNANECVNATLRVYLLCVQLSIFNYIFLYYCQSNIYPFQILTNFYNYFSQDIFTLKLQNPKYQ